jgi:hypothetical protein
VTTRSRILRTVGFGAAVLALSGCSAGFHPGNAAAVDGTTISESSVDDVMDAACAYTEDFAKQNAQVQKLDRVEYRGVFLTGMIQAAITDEIATSQGLTVSDAQVESTAVTSVNSIPDSLSDSETDALTQYFEDQARSSIQQALIGKHADDPSITNGSQLTSDEISADKPHMTTYFKEADVDVNPSYGTWNGTSIDSGTGSLSVLAAGTTPAPSDNQQCG